MADKDWPLAAKQFQTFSQDTLRHFAREEDVLFPAVITSYSIHYTKLYDVGAMGPQTVDILQADAAVIRTAQDRVVPCQLHAEQGEFTGGVIRHQALV